MAHLGIDEHRRGRARFAADPQTGEYILLADRWHTCFFDLDGEQGLLGQVQGRTADDAAYWLAGATPAWRDAVQVVAHRHVHHLRLSGAPHAAARAPRPWTCSTSSSSPSRPSATCGAGSSGPGTGGVAAPATPSTASRACWCGTWSTCHLPSSPRSSTPWTRDRYGQEIAAAWIAKEKLRDALNLRARVTGSTPCERQVRDRLFAFYDWCAQHDDIPELHTLARTISRWEDEIVTAVVTGVTNDLASHCTSC